MSDDEIIREAREAFERAADAEAESRREALDDLRFARLGEQWPEKVRRERELDGRPCLTINRLPAFIRQSAVGDDLRGITQAQDQAPVTSAAQIVAMLQGLPMGLFTGSTTSGTQNTQTKGQTTAINGQAGIQFYPGGSWSGIPLG